MPEKEQKIKTEGGEPVEAPPNGGGRNTPQPPRTGDGEIIPEVNG